MLSQKAIAVSGYRFLQKHWIKPLASRIRFENLTEKDFSFPVHASRPCRYWFHAASVGELEALTPLVQECAKQEGALALSIFSASAASSLKKLGQAFQEQTVYVGFSPWEGEWQDVFRKTRPEVFITSKYEAWPELWISLVEQEIGLVIVGARPSRSLKIAKRICLLLCGRLPKMLLMPFNEEDALQLKNIFPDATLSVVLDPRWDRVLQRMDNGNPRANELIRLFNKEGERVGILGSAWLSDLEFLKPVLCNFEGTLWVVPHSLKAQTMEEMVRALQEMGWDVLRTRGCSTSPSVSSKKRCMFVDEVGVLAELYSIAAWAYVGGGFGEGVHSTIEPAVHGLPIAIGPERAEEFSEVRQLEQKGQLTLLRDSSQLKTWIGRVFADEFTSQRRNWAESARRYHQCSSKILAQVENFKRSC